MPVQPVVNPTFMFDSFAVTLYVMLNNLPVVGLVVEDPSSATAILTVPAPARTPQPFPVGSMQFATVIVLGPRTVPVRLSLTGCSTVGSARTVMSNALRLPEA